MQARFQRWVRFESWVLAILMVGSLAWGVLILESFRSSGLPLCSAKMPTGGDFHAIAMAPRLVGSSVLMAVIMVPLTITPLRHVRNRSFVTNRTRAALIFVACYLLVWIVGYLVLEFAVAATWVSTSSGVPSFAAEVASALLWQSSPAKQWSLNRCHRRPELSAFGWSANRDIARYGLSHGGYCFAACGALMGLPLLLPHDQLAAMITVTGFVAAERLERPAPLIWRLRGVGKTLKIVEAESRQLGMHIGLFSVRS